MSIKTFRGLLTDGQQERIRLETRDGKQGYQIKKLEIITENPGTTAYEHIIKVFSIQQTAVTADINFSEQTLLACGFTKGDELTYRSAGTTQIIFDGVTFNQDIFITQFDTKDALSCNYYLELEQVSLDDAEASAVILKNFRNTNSYQT